LKFDLFNTAGGGGGSVSVVNNQGGETWDVKELANQASGAFATSTAVHTAWEGKNRITGDENYVTSGALMLRAQGDDDSLIALDSASLSFTKAFSMTSNNLAEPPARSKRVATLPM
jgi:hypothetical protein